MPLTTVRARFLEDTPQRSPLCSQDAAYWVPQDLLGQLCADIASTC